MVLASKLLKRMRRKGTFCIQMKLSVQLRSVMCQKFYEVWDTGTGDVEI